MEVAPVIAVAVVALVTVVGNFVWPSRARRIDRALAAKPRVLVHDAHGTVRLTGRVRRVGELLRAPLSGRPCIAYEVFVDETGRAGSGARWRRRVDLREARPFLVADESGEARIDPAGPFRMALEYDRTGTTGWPNRYPGKHQELGMLLASTDVVPTSWLGYWRSFRYAEGVLEEGALVSVSGASTLEVDPNGERQGPRSPPERLVLRGTEALPLLISDGSAARGEPGPS